MKTKDKIILCGVISDFKDETLKECRNMHPEFIEGVKFTYDLLKKAVRNGTFETVLTNIQDTVNEVWKEEV